MAKSGPAGLRAAFWRAAGRAFVAKAGMADFPDIVEAPLRARFVSLGVNSGEVEERFIRGTGAGGQKINKTSSTVWLRHRPSGIEVRCQRERSQNINRLLAWTELAEKLEWRRAEAANAAQAERELHRRQTRQKSYGQKIRMIQSKKHRARTKSSRGRVGSD
ncbi:MAG TPA: peptide chain release factor-like protein [Candidatus Didemnitutus sp.]|nr:peptide chain release factor-like protein [Candidatus Didemnitutus sp.]